MLSFCVTVDYSLFLLYQLAIKECICTLYVQLCCKYHILKKLLGSSAAWRSRVYSARYYNWRRGSIWAMATTHGVIGPFDSSQEDWLSYIARLQNYFVLTISPERIRQSSVGQSYSVSVAFQPID